MNAVKALTSNRRRTTFTSAADEVKSLLNRIQSFATAHGMQDAPLHQLVSRMEAVGATTRSPSLMRLYR